MGLVPCVASDLGGIILERIKKFSHFVVLVNLSKGGYWMKTMTAGEFDGSVHVKRRKSASASFREFFSITFPDEGGSLVSRDQKKKSTTAKSPSPLKMISCNGHMYDLDRKSAFTLHGWYPFLKESRWNAWRQVYNMLYRYFIATGLLYYEEPGSTKKSKDSDNNVEELIAPMTWSVDVEKWTPGLVQAVNLSRLEERYNKHVNFGSFAMSWKVALVIGIVIIFALLFFTGRIQI